MRQQVDVVYENGVLRPLKPLPLQLQEHQHLTVTIDALDVREARLDAACVAAAKRDADPTVSLEEVRGILAKVQGTLAEAVHAERDERYAQEARMAEHFYDTSAAAKHYRAEQGTAKVDLLLADSASRHYLSTLGVLEAHSVFARLVRTGQIAAWEFHRLRGRLLADIAVGLWQIIQVTPADFQQAQQLLLRHATARGHRTMDALQLAVALSLHASMPLDTFVCADANLAAIATAEGLTVVNPEVP